MRVHEPFDRSAKAGLLGRAQAAYSSSRRVYVSVRSGVQPRQHGNLMVLVALFGGGGRGYGTQARGSTPLDRRDGYNSVENQSLLASAWLPISDGVLERGHLEEG